MKRAGLIWGLCCAVALSAGVGHSAVLYPFLNPVRTEITNEIATGTSGTNFLSPAELRNLTQARNALSRGGVVSLVNDLQVLTIVSTLLSRGNLAPAFQPLLNPAIQDYADVLDALSATIATRLSALPPSDDTAYVQTTLDYADGLIERARAESTLTASRLLSRAAIRLVSLRATVTRIARTTAPIPISPALNAFVNGRSFRVALPSGAAFNPAFGAITITGTQVVGFESQTLLLSIANVRSGTTTHQLGDVGTGSYAIFSRGGTNPVGFTSVSGSAIVTLDLISQTVSGTFSFVGVNRDGLDAPIQVSGGTFVTSVR